MRELGLCWSGSSPEALQTLVLCLSVAVSLPPRHDSNTGLLITVRESYLVRIDGRKYHVVGQHFRFPGNVLHRLVIEPRHAEEA